MRFINDRPRSVGFVIRLCRVAGFVIRKNWKNWHSRSVGFAIRLYRVAGFVIRRNWQNCLPLRAILSSALVVLATGWLAACSSDDLVADGSTDTTDTTPATDTSDTLDAISFGGAMSGDEEETTTRASGLEDMDVTSFTLWGYKNLCYRHTDLQTVFPGYTVSYKANTANTTTDNTDDWYYVGVEDTQTIKYWDYSATAYRFMAYATTTDDNTVEVSDSYAASDTLKVFSFTADGSNTDTAPYVSQLWFSDNIYGTEPGYGETVELTFSKPFARVRIMIVDEKGDTLSYGGDYASKIDANTINFVPTDPSATVATAGTVTVSYPLTGDDTQESYSYSDTTPATISIPYEGKDEDGNLALATEEKKWYTVLPNTGQGSYTFSLIYSSIERTAVVPEQYMQWRAGYQYTYVFKLTSDAVTFQPALYVYTKWQAGYAETAKW